MNLNLLLIICLAIKRRINVDEINSPTVFLQQMTPDLEIVSPENLVDPAVLLLTIGLPQLCGIVLRGADRGACPSSEARETLLSLVSVQIQR